MHPAVVTKGSFPCPGRTARWLTAAVLAMAALSVIGQVVRYRATNESVRRIALLFKLSAEHTIPAYASAAMLLASAGLLWAIGRRARGAAEPFAAHWTWLGVIFAYLSVDEAVGIHERATEPMRAVMGRHADGFLHYAWVVPAAALVVAVGLAYLGFLRHLRPTVRNRMLLAGATYVGGAIGMEMVGAHFASTIGTSSVAYALSAVVEETMEMLGVVVFIHALLTYLSTHPAAETTADPRPRRAAEAALTPAPALRNAAERATV